MKCFYIVLFFLMVTMPKIGMAEIINDATLVQYYTKGKTAYEQRDWITALRYLFTYQELNKINTAKNSSLKPIDVSNLIEYSKSRVLAQGTVSNITTTITKSIDRPQPNKPIASEPPALTGPRMQQTE